MPPETVAKVNGFIKSVGGGSIIPGKYEGEGVHTDVIRSLLKVQHIHRGRVSCILTVKPHVCNAYNTLHGGAVGSIAEIVAIACARTVVNKDKELFLGELSVSYLAAAISQAEVIVDASVVRSGRNLTVVAIEFKLKDTERLTYMCRATFYNMPVASL
ncbi:Phenylacetic acid degradation-related domain-containing protein [Artemisia annua]|uniref:Phenylacetic acid degradation-related domain-containing protein n=1 Tax=Artemisia annua TaxID=35608 RepID=A0A2U1Q0L1_ARTAN|nr:Phenylacetic acid degradation-related domain-containing protein [Artemisia annua]